MRTLEVKPSLPTRYIKIGKRLKLLYAQKSGAERSDGDTLSNSDRQNEGMTGGTAYRERVASEEET